MPWPRTRPPAHLPLGALCTKASLHEGNPASACGFARKRRLLGDDGGMKNVIGWVLVALQFVLLIALVLMPRREPEALWVAVGGLLIGAGAAVGFSAFRALGSALTPTPVPIAGAGLRTEGIYARIRHPIYLAVLLLVFGYVIAFGSWWSFLVAVILVIFFAAKARWEDHLLAETYGSDWAAWASTTGALIPRLRS